MKSKLEYEVICGECGTKIEYIFRNGKIEITPCEGCLECEREAGYEEGYEARKDESFDY